MDSWAEVSNGLNRRRWPKGRELICVDLPGFGKNAPSPPIDRIDGFASWVLDALERDGVRQFDLLGHSMGGMIAQEMTRQAPDRIDRLILYATGAEGVFAGALRADRDVDGSRAGGWSASHRPTHRRHMVFARRRGASIPRLRRHRRAVRTCRNSRWAGSHAGLVRRGSPAEDRRPNVDPMGRLRPHVLMDPDRDALAKNPEQQPRGGSLLRTRGPYGEAGSV